MFAAAAWALLVAASDGPPIVYEGNVALPDPVYDAVLRQAGDAAGPASPEYAERVAQRLQSFLRDSDYVLAEVEAEMGEDGVIRVRINEGRLDRIIFLGIGGGTSLGLQLAFDLPGKVFNVARVESELARLSEQVGFRTKGYTLVPVDTPEHVGLQIGPQTLGPLTLIEPGQDHELRIVLEPPPERPGFDVGLGFRPPDGVFADVRWRFINVFMDADRFELETTLAVDIDELANEPEDRLGITRVGAKARWFTPPLGVPWLRSFLQVEGSGFGRDRPDIGVDSYIFAPLAGSASLQFDFGQLQTYLGFGVEWRNVLRVRAEEEDPPVLADEALNPPSNTRPFGKFGSRLNLSPDRLRQDRLHLLEFDVRILAPGDAASEEAILQVEAGWENTWTFGYNELRGGLRGTYLGGDVPYFDEVAFGDGFFRVAFLDELFVQRILSGRTEYRMSLSREVFKISLFNDLAVYEALDRARTSAGAQVADNLGVGFHVLALDMFQVDVYTGVGFTSRGDFDVGVSLAVEQVF